jgi:hypothetical protein
LDGDGDGGTDAWYGNKSRIEQGLYQEIRAFSNVSTKIRNQIPVSADLENPGGHHLLAASHTQCHPSELGGHGHGAWNFSSDTVLLKQLENVRE